jgi:TDG/mug DNA glycosylase family protein
MSAPLPLPDLLRDDLKVVFCGLNPGLRAAAAGRHFEGRSNRFWRVLHLAGFTPTLLAPQDDARLLDFGCGLTTVVARPTAGADSLTRGEFQAARPDLEAKIERFRPRFVAFLGKAAYAALADSREIAWGRQSGSFGGAGVWVLPNPSGRNLSFTLADLVDAYQDLREAADARVPPAV